MAGEAPGSSRVRHGEGLGGIPARRDSDGDPMDYGQVKNGPADQFLVPAVPSEDNDLEPAENRGLDETVYQTRMGLGPN